MLGHAIADARELLQLFHVFRDFLDAVAEAIEKFGGAFVAAKAVVHRAIDFEELGGFAQDAGDFAIFHVGIIEQRRTAKSKSDAESYLPVDGR